MVSREGWSYVFMAVGMTNLVIALELWLGMVLTPFGFLISGLLGLGIAFVIEHWPRSR